MGISISARLPLLDLVVQHLEDSPPSQSTTDHVMTIADAVHRSINLDDEEDAMTGTVGLTELGGSPDEADRQGLVTQVLVVRDGHQTKIVGAVVFKPLSGSGERLAYEMLEVVARSLSDVQHSSEVASASAE